MEITLVIVGGVIILTLVTVVGDIIGKSKAAKAAVNPKALQELVQRVEILEKLAEEREKEIRRLEADIAFANKLLEDGHGNDSGGRS